MALTQTETKDIFATEIMKPLYSNQLQEKINYLTDKRTPIKLGSLAFDSMLIMAPMASICNAPFRLLMQELGAGGTVSELISCHGINYGNERTTNMLYIHPEEKNMGIQIFGEDPESMARAAKVVEAAGPGFIDINMGCPVKKVVSKGAGSALLKNPAELIPYFKTIKSAISIPLTVKIRTGWDESSINALEVCDIAKDEGLEFIAIHGRTRAQAYRGKANWEYLEEVAAKSILPVVGNGDLHTSDQVKQRLQNTNCKALMIARGAIRNPFIFLESMDEDNLVQFNALDILEVINRLKFYITTIFERERTQVVQLRKHIMWFAAGLPHTTKFREKLFLSQSVVEIEKITDEYFLAIGPARKHINYQESFMTSGHG